jgi:sugar phosphate isomerase/epimerase
MPSESAAMTPAAVGRRPEARLIGWCRPLADAPLMRDIGLDFIEVALAPLGLENAESFAKAKRQVTRSALPTLAFNNFLPQNLRVVGPEADIPRFKVYLARAAELLAHGGARIVVYGSGWARNVPDGYERARAEAEFTESLRRSADALAGTGTILVIEPLNRAESNIANSVAEGVRFAEAVSRPEVKVLADFYHMDEENEPLDELVVNAGWLAHVHLADTGRMSPGTGSYPYDRFFAKLREARYQGMISAECGVNELETDMRASLAFLRGFWS